MRLMAKSTWRSELVKLGSEELTERYGQERCTVVGMHREGLAIQGSTLWRRKAN